MKPNLDQLRSEIEEYLNAHDFVVFHGYSRLLDTIPIIHWDCASRPDYRLFLHTAKQIGAKMIVYHQREFTPDHIDDALARLDDAALPRDQQRMVERRLRDMRVYEGFTCALELSYDFQGRLFLFDLRTEWYEELSDILDELDAATTGPEDDSGPLGGYFSKN